jgi:TPR repeat protein
MFRFASVTLVLLVTVALCRAEADSSLTVDHAAPPPVMLPGEAQHKTAVNLLYNLDTPSTDPIAATAEAVELLHEAADVGYPASQTLLGVLHAFGIGVERSEAKAVLYYTFAAMNGDVEANAIMAHRTHHGVGTPKSCLKAAKYAKVAADAVAQGYSAGVQRIFDTTKLGDDTERVRQNTGRNNFDIHLMQADQGVAQSCMIVGMAYTYGLMGAPQDADLAVEYYTKALKLGEKAAYGALGQLYLHGAPDGHSKVKRNIELAKKLFAKGAEDTNQATGHGTSLNGLGYLHAIGAMSPDGTHDWAKAFDLFKKSADQGNSEGLYNLGLLHLNGKGTKRDVDVARTLLQQARITGSVLARYQLANLDLFRLGKDAGNCMSALHLFAEVNERGRWRVRADHAKEHYAAAEYGAALLDYLYLAEQGVGHALHNAAHILSSDSDHNIALLAQWDTKSHRKGAQRQGDAHHGDLRAVSQPALTPAAATGASEESVASASAADGASTGSAVLDDPDTAPLHPRDVVLHAILWRAVQLGDRHAHLKLGDNYYYGRGTTRSLRRAEEHYLQSAQAGSAEGNFNVALTYQYGSRYTKQDFHLAKRHFDAALAADPNGFFAVKLALLRLNLVWWWQHFAPKASPPVRDGAAATPEPPSPGHELPSAPHAEAEEADWNARADVPDQQWYEAFGETVDRWMPTYFGMALDTLILVVCVVAALLLLQLRNHAHG